MSSEFGSKNEENIYRALQRLKLDFEYQYPLDGGRGVRGGQVIDFIVWIPPQAVAIYGQSYWHTGARGLEDSLKQAAAERRGFRVVEIWDHESMTIDDAVNAIREKVI